LIKNLKKEEAIYRNDEPHRDPCYDYVHRKIYEAKRVSERAIQQATEYKEGAKERNELVIIANIFYVVNHRIEQDVKSMEPLFHVTKNKRTYKIIGARQDYIAFTSVTTYKNEVIYSF
jgi:hypothetical protein